MQRIQHQCGCVETIYKPFDPAGAIIEMCSQHISIANNPEYRQQLCRMLPQAQNSTTIPGIPSHAFHPFQMGGGFRPGQMPPQGVHIRMPTSGTGR